MSKKQSSKVVYGLTQTKDGLSVYKKTVKSNHKLSANQSFRFTDVRAMIVESLSKQMDDLRKLRHTVYTSKEKGFSKLQQRINKG